MENQLLEKYARLLTKTGVNIQPGQILVITSPIECADFARMIAETAYKEGAHDVVMNWRDELFAKVRFMLAPEKVFEEFPSWQKEFYLSYMKKGAAFISIAASDPEILKDVDPKRVATAQKTANIELKEYRETLMSNKNVWCVASIPTKPWAKKVFPDSAEEDAVEKLWEAIFKAVRVNEEDPVAAWEVHKANLKKNMEFLNSHHLKSLHFKNSLGTDLTVGLPMGHLWLGGSEYTPGGTEFVANMPTEEVFSMPDKKGVNGHVVSSKPLNYNGNLIENFSLTFKDGKVVDFTAEKGYEVLKKLLETDEGSAYLGEVALVPYDSPISRSKLLFFNTLFDENASCHLAFGKAYPVCIKNGENMSEEQLAAQGVNDSLVHVDFMIGTEDLEITGITVEGKKVPVFIKGNFAQ